MGNFADGCPDTGHTCADGEGGSLCSLNNCPGCSECNGCFPHSALIDTPQGKAKIGDLSVGQTVWSFQNGEMVKRAITKKLVHGLAKIVIVQFGEGEASIRCTIGHSFLTDKGYLALSEIKAGDSIVHIDQTGKHLRVISGITIAEKMEQVFNLYTQGEHNFIVDGYVAHNFTHFRKVRTVLHRLFFDSFPEIRGLRA